jgi:hypothetical protein
LQVFKKHAGVYTEFKKFCKPGQAVNAKADPDALTIIDTIKYVKFVKTTAEYNDLMDKKKVAIEKERLAKEKAENTAKQAQ